MFASKKYSYKSFDAIKIQKENKFSIVSGLNVIDISS